MRILIRKLKTAIKLSSIQKAWILPLYILSGIMNLLIQVLPFRWILPFMGKSFQNSEMSILASSDQEKRAQQLGNVIKMVANNTPWESKCLVQALLARVVLRFHKIPHIVFFGIAKPEVKGESPKAHAWVSTGRYFVTGGTNNTFTVISSFVSDKDINA